MLSNNKTTFDKVREYINKSCLKFGIVQRKQLIELGHTQTIDNYRKLLTHAGYLSKTRTPGLYIKLKDIKSTVTLTELKQLAYDN